MYEKEDILNKLDDLIDNIHSKDLSAQIVILAKALKFIIYYIPEKEED